MGGVIPCLLQLPSQIIQQFLKFPGILVLLNRLLIVDPCLPHSHPLMVVPIEVLSTVVLPFIQEILKLVLATQAKSVRNLPQIGRGSGYVNLRPTTVTLQCTFRAKSIKIRNIGKPPIGAEILDQ